MQRGTNTQAVTDNSKLLKALDDESNDVLLNFTTEKIIEMNLKILNELEWIAKFWKNLPEIYCALKFPNEISIKYSGAFITEFIEFFP